MTIDNILSNYLFNPISAGCSPAIRNREENLNIIEQNQIYCIAGRRNYLHGHDTEFMNVNYPDAAGSSVVADEAVEEGIDAQYYV